MSTPDAPLATVRAIGPSEIIAAVGLISSLLIAVLGHDFGIAQNAQAIATVGVVVIPPFLGLIRAHKHGAAMAANAAVTVAQLQQGITPQGPPPTALTPAGSVPLSVARDARGRYIAKVVAKALDDHDRDIADAMTRAIGE